MPTWICNLCGETNIDLRVAVFVPLVCTRCGSAKPKVELDLLDLDKEIEIEIED